LEATYENLNNLDYTGSNHFLLELLCPQGGFMKSQYYIMKRDSEDSYLSIDGIFTKEINNDTAFFNEAVAVIIKKTLARISPWSEFQILIRLW
jgi:hypothetical protein